MAYIIAVDAGTSSLRSVLFNTDGKQIFMAQTQYEPIFPRDGYVEQDPRVWKKALYQTLAQAAAYAEKNSIPIDAISITSQRSSVFPVDVRGEPLHNALMWHDKRSVQLCERLRDREMDVYSRTGLRIDPMFSAPKMAWFRENEPELYAKSHKLLGVHEYLLFCLCGEFVTDHSVGSRTMLMNLTTLHWDDKLLELFGIEREKLCTLVRQGSVCGRLKGAAALECGLKAGTAVIAAGGDQQCSALGLGILNSGQIEVTTGTGAYVIGISDKPVLDPEMRFLCNVSALPGRYILEAPILTAGNVYQWFARTFIDEQEGKSVVEQAGELAVQSPVGANGLMLFPYFKGRGSPSWNPNAKGVMLNLTLDTSKSDFARAILEGIALEVAQNIKLIGRCYENSTKEILMSGGLTKLPLYNQIISDATALKVRVRDNNEATALGAWLSAAVATGIFNNLEEVIHAVLKEQSSALYMPIEENRKQYSELCKIREQLYTSFYQ